MRRFSFIRTVVLAVYGCFIWLPDSLMSVHASAPSRSVPSIPITHRTNKPSTMTASLLTRLLKMAGYVIPSSLKSEVDKVVTYFGCDSWELDVRDDLVLYNVSLGVQGQPMLAQIGKIRIKWDSYTQPCLDIEMSDINIWLEFLNLQLTKSNWAQFVEEESLPDLSEYYYGDTDEDPVSTLRFHGVTLRGRGAVHVHSRPLRRKLGTISLDMGKTRELNLEINQRSELNLQRTGRKGCTTTEMYEIVRNYANRQVKKLAVRVLADAAVLPDEAMDKAERILNIAGENLRDYADVAGRQTGGQLQQAILSKMEEVGASKMLNKWGGLLQQAASAVDSANMQNSDQKDSNVGRIKDL